ncbi:hypothetical protein ACF0H5_001234 [Mactra antiquata]
MAEKQNRVAEDVVEYSLFPTLPGKKDNLERVRSLEECINSYLLHLSPTLINVVWQNDGFQLRAVEENGCVPSHLFGETNFAENVQDEWFIVYLLFQLTKHFKGLVVRVIDCDGEFMLIEAADVLPKWLNPEKAENRVYIYNGELHIIPIPQSPGDIASFPPTITSVTDAIECIRSYPQQTKASQKIQTAVNNRIKHFPGMMSEHIHYSHCYIPASIAAILDEKPQLIAPAVRAFYYRDPIDLKCCRTFKYFRPGTRVMNRTRFTRCLYAQLVHQNFQPDKRSGWVMPTTSSPKFRSHDLGMKLAHGFEILAHKSEDVNDDDNYTEDISSNNMKWQKFLKTLNDKNYFKGELEGSKLYQKLVQNAKTFYKENFQQQNSCTDAGTEILHLLKTLNVDIEARRKAERDLKSPDDDSWMNLTPESLDEMMQERSGLRGNKQHNNTDNVFDLSKVADSMKNFVGNVSSIDGAEFPSGIDDDDDDDDADIQFDGGGFINAIQEMFEFEDSEETDSSSDMDEYGWDDDSNTESTTTRSSKKSEGIKRPPSLDKYMDIMDRELSKTEVGKSFEKQKKSPKKTSQTTKSKPESKDIDEEDDDFQPVDIDLNTVKNLLESYGAQEGLAGPTSNILGSMGVNIPPNSDKIENGETVTPIQSGPPKPVPRSNSSNKKAPPRPPPPRAPRARLDSKETTI